MQIRCFLAYCVKLVLRVRSKDFSPYYEPAYPTAFLSVSEFIPSLIAEVHLSGLDDQFSPLKWTSAISPELQFWAGLPVCVTGGLLVAHTAWEMVTAHQRLTPSENDEAIDKDQFSNPRRTSPPTPLRSKEGSLAPFQG